MTQEEIKTFRELFREEHPYIELQQVEDNLLERFLKQAYIRIHNIGTQINLCADWIQANQICEIVE